MKLAGFIVVLLLALGLACAPLRGRIFRDPRAFFAARGQFGVALFFLLSLGETYSIGSVLGFPGGIAASGSIDVALWFVGYILLAFPVGMVLYPRLWQVGNRLGAITLPDLLGGYFQSTLVGRVTGLVLVILMLPLGTMQFIGLDAVFSTLALPISPVMLSAFAALLAFLFVAGAGLRGAALSAALKDGLILLSIVCVAFAALVAWPHQATRPLAVALRGASPHPFSACVMIMSTIVTQAFGFCIAPQTAAAVFSARDPQTIRRAQIWMPLYMVLFPLLVVIACYGLTHPVFMGKPDSVFLSVASHLLPGWGVGIVSGAVALTALVWLGAVCLSLAAIVTGSFMPHLGASSRKRTGLGVIALYLGLSVLTAAMHTALIVTLNRLFYVGLAQLLPAVLICVMGYRVSPGRLVAALALGLLSGGVVFGLGWTPFGLSPALPGLLVNVAVLFQAGMLRREPLAVWTQGEEHGSSQS